MKRTVKKTFRSPDYGDFKKRLQTFQGIFPSPSQDFLRPLKTCSFLLTFHFHSIKKVKKGNPGQTYFFSGARCKDKFAETLISLSMDEASSHL